MRSSWIVPLALACALSAFACGGDDDDDGTASVTATASGSTKPSRTLAAASTATPDAGSSAAPTVVPVPTPELELVVLPSTWASGVARDIPTLVGAAGQVFLGEVLRLKEQTEEPQAGPRPDVPISSFEVRVDTVIAGTVSSGSLVTIDQVGGTTTQSDGTIVTLQLEGDEFLSVGARYLFFAANKSNGSLSSPPFGRFEVGADGTLQAIQYWVMVPVAIQLSGLTTEEALNEINAAIN